MVITSASDSVLSQWYFLFDLSRLGASPLILIKVLSMKKEHTDQALALIGIALLMFASGGDTLMFDDTIKKAVMKAIGIDTDIDRKEKNEPEGYGPSDYVYGIRGLSDYLGVSPPTAQKYVNSGKLDAAMRKVGRKYSFHKASVDEIFRKR